MAIRRGAKSTNKKKITKIATGGRHPGAGTTQMPPGYSKKGSSPKGKLPPKLKQILSPKFTGLKAMKKKPLKTSPRKRYRGPEPRIR